MVVAGFSGHTDLTKAAEISNDVRRVVKNLKECQDLSLLYNQRERLFNMNVTQVCMSVCALVLHTCYASCVLYYFMCACSE